MSHNAQHYRNRARELREEAAVRDEETVRNILINVAEQCEKMANELEARARPRPAQPHGHN